MKIIDLIFIRLYVTYERKNDLPLFSSVMFMGVISLTLLLFIGVFLDLLCNIKLPFTDKKDVLYVIFLIEFPFLIWLFYHFRNKDKINKIKQVFSEDKYKRIKSWHIFMIPILFILAVFIITLIFGNPLFGNALNLVIS